MKNLAFCPVDDSKDEKEPNHIKLGYGIQVAIRHLQREASSGVRRGIFINTLNDLLSKIPTLIFKNHTGKKEYIFLNPKFDGEKLHFSYAHCPNGETSEIYEEVPIRAINPRSILVGNHSDFFKKKNIPQ